MTNRNMQSKTGHLIKKLSLRMAQIKILVRKLPP